MLKMVETQHEEYVTRLRTENKKLVNQQEIELRIKEMEFEDIRSLFTMRLESFKNMKLQCERDRVDKRILESKLRKMTEDRDEFKTKFMTTTDILDKTQNKLNEVSYDYEMLKSKFDAISKLNEQTNMKKEEYRSILFNYDQQFKQLSEWEKRLKELEKELRSIKKRDNPYEYVDFADKKTQTNMMLKEKGCNTDQLVIGYSDSQNSKSRKKARSKVRSSLANTVTTALGGIPIQTEIITDYDLPTPNEMRQSTMTRNMFQPTLKVRPQSSNLIATTYSYNTKNGIIEEEDDPLGLGGFSTRNKDPYQTVSTFNYNNFNSPSALRPTALQKHQKAYKSQYRRKIREEDQTSSNMDAGTSTKNDKNSEKMKSVYIHYANKYQTRPMTEQPGMRKDKKRGM